MVWSLILGSVPHNGSSRRTKSGSGKPHDRNIHPAVNLEYPIWGRLSETTRNCHINSWKGQTNTLPGSLFETAVTTVPLLRCCAVALAQHLGQNICFAQQPPRGWLRAAQNAIWGAQYFRRRRKIVLRPLFCRMREGKGIFFLLAVDEKKTWRPTFLFAVVDNKINGPFCYSP